MGRGHQSWTMSWGARSGQNWTRSCLSVRSLLGQGVVNVKLGAVRRLMQGVVNVELGAGRVMVSQSWTYPWAIEVMSIYLIDSIVRIDVWVGGNTATIVQHTCWTFRLLIITPQNCLYGCGQKTVLLWYFHIWKRKARTKIRLLKKKNQFLLAFFLTILKAGFGKCRRPRCNWS